MPAKSCANPPMRRAVANRRASVELRSNILLKPVREEAIAKPKRPKGAELATVKVVGDVCVGKKWELVVGNMVKVDT